MIKIIKQGEIPKQENTIYKFKCDYCNTEFETDEVEKEKMLNGNVYARCPLCDKLLWVRNR
jgi:uncharacterized protein with PIN domain